MSVRGLIRDRVFLAGLALRAALILALAPLAASSGLLGVLHGLGLSPGVGGWANLVAFGPAVVVAGAAGLCLVTLALDVGAYLLLVQVSKPERRAQVAALYWLSPVALLAIYVQARLELLALVLLLGGFFALARRRHVAAGALFGLAAAAQPLLITAAPFFLLYLFGAGRMREAAKPAALALGAGLAVALLPLVFGAYRQSLGAGDVGLLLGAKWTLPTALTAYVAPLAYTGLLYTAWRVRRLDLDLLWTFTGLNLLIIFLLAAPAPGVLLLLPFLVAHSAYAQGSGRVLLGLFTLAFVGLALLAPGAPAAAFAAAMGGGVLISALTTVLLASGLALGVQMMTRGVGRSPYRLAMRRPFAVGISGDSGAGKDTLVVSMAGMFGGAATAHLSGDDYHLWDRNKPMWRAVTHLSPKANDLDAFARDVASLLDRRSVKVRHYDHATGRMTKPGVVDHAEVVAVSGLHALWSPSLNALYDVRIYLDMDEDLRRFLKIRRDVTVRGHSLARVMSSIERRWIDSQHFIHPQAEAADLVLKLQARHASALADLTSRREIPLRLTILAKPGHDFDPLARILTSLCGMQVIEAPLEKGYMEVSIEGEATAEDIAAAAGRLAPDMRDLLALSPRWEEGLRGVMQLVILDQFERVRRRRSVNA